MDVKPVVAESVTVAGSYSAIDPTGKVYVPLAETLRRRFPYTYDVFDCPVIAPAAVLLAINS